MFRTHIILVVCIACVLPFCVTSVQIRLSNNNDRATAPNYNDGAADTYSYNYGISDQATGDSKTKWEQRENNVVRGAYSIVEPDGTTRLVQYTADANGFHPVITKLDGTKSGSNLSPNYNIPASNIYNPPELEYRIGHSQRSSNILNYNGVTNKQQSYQTSSYPTPLSGSSYNNAYNNRAMFAGYDALSNGYDNSNVFGAPYPIPLRQDIQPTPLLHLAYHGYDNLYH